MRKSQRQRFPPVLLSRQRRFSEKKYLSENCLLEQAYVKDPDQTVQQILTAMIAKMGENMMVKRFARFQIGA